MGATPFSRRLLIASILLGLFLIADVALFGWLLLRSLSQREVSRALLETREEAETLAQRLEGRAREQGEDLFLAVATERETQTYINAVLRQRDMVRTVEIRDQDGNLVYQMQSRELMPLGEGEGAQVGGPERAPHLEQRTVERQETYDVYDLSVPIGTLGQIHIGISREELGRRVEALRQDLLRQAGVVGALTLALLLTAYLIIWWLFRRGRMLELQAAESERMAYIGTLAAGLAHEIRNPLNSLNLNMQMLEEDLDSPAPGSRGSTQRLLTITRSEIGRLERLVTDFLAYARPRPVELEPVAAVDLLAHVKEVLCGQVSALRGAVRVEDESDRACIAVDAQQMKQLLFNLAQNGIQATEECGRLPQVVLRARREDDRLALEVEDNGTGIPPQERERIFDLFYSTRKGGTGLGLAIVKRIAHSHGGELEVESTPGEGTVIRLWLPVAPSHQEAPAPAQPALAGSGSS